MGDTPRFIKQLARKRMAETGEKYTEARRAVLADVDGAREQWGKPPGGADKSSVKGDPN